MNRDVVLETSATVTATRVSSSSEAAAAAAATACGSGSHRMTLLPETFAPGENDVICGRGKKCYNHVGNERFRKRVVAMLEEYSRARSKLDKSSVLSEVVDQVRLNSPNGGFVKQDQSGRWFEVGDFLAREKTSQAFRDALHDHYKSSNISKKKRRQEEQAKATDKMHKFVHSEFDIAARMDRYGKSVPDSQDFLNKANFEILTRLNRLSDLRQDRGLAYNGDDPAALDAPYPRLSGQNATAPSTFQFGDSAFQSISTSSPSHYHHQPNMESYSEVISRSRHRDFDFTSELTSRRPRAYSLPSSPANVPYTDERDTDTMHHSLPNLHLSNQAAAAAKARREDSIDEMEAMHHSMPLLQFHHDPVDLQPHASFGSLDPIPLKSVQRRHPGHPVGSTSRMMRSFGGSFKTPSVPEESMSTSSHHLSNELVACFEKITSPSVADDNPFEPIPLTATAVAAPVESGFSGAAYTNRPLRPVNPSSERGRYHDVDDDFSASFEDDEFVIG